MHQWLATVPSKVGSDNGWRWRWHRVAETRESAKISLNSNWRMATWMQALVLATFSPLTSPLVLLARVLRRYESIPIRKSVFWSVAKHVGARYLLSPVYWILKQLQSFKTCGKMDKRDLGLGLKFRYQILKIKNGWTKNKDRHVLPFPSLLSSYLSAKRISWD